MVGCNINDMSERVILIICWAAFGFVMTACLLAPDLREPVDVPHRTGTVATALP